MTWHYTVLDVYTEKLEETLNDLEDKASGRYEIVSIAGRGLTNSVVVLRFAISEEFNEKQLKAKLGF